MIKYYIWLSLALGAGNNKVCDIFNKFGNPENVFRAGDLGRKETGIFSVAELNRLKKISIGDAQYIERYCKIHGIEIIGYGSDKYPYCLSVIENPPVVLYIKGKMPDFDNIPAICIVGPRNVSEYGKKVAYALGYRLAKSGMTVVSGGALGSDSYAHAGAIKADGKTTLVMGCGIDSDYLRENEPLRKSVIKNGCLISEYPPKTPASKYTFPIRNRIMSALSVGTVVVEASKRSGALITAGHALEQGKDVFVIPGNPTEPQYIGSNALLRDGAKPLIDVSDIFNEYILRFPDKIDVKKAYEKSRKTEEKPKEKKINKKIFKETLSKEAKIVYNYLDKHKFYPEEIRDTGLSSNELIAALTELEIEMVIRALPGGCYELIQD